MWTCTEGVITCFESVYPPHRGPSCAVPYLTSECEEQASGATSVQGAAGRRGSTAQTTATGTNLSHLNYSSSRWIPFLLNFKLKQTYSARFSTLHPMPPQTKDPLVGKEIRHMYITNVNSVYSNCPFILTYHSFQSFFNTQAWVACKLTLGDVLDQPTCPKGQRLSQSR